MSKNATTRVRSTVGTTDSFHLKIGLHQGSALSPLLFNILFDVITENVREEPEVGVTRRDRIRNEYMRATVKVTEISKKIQESRLGWYGHLRRRAGEDHIGREVMEIELLGNRRKGRPKRRWIDSIDGDLREKNLNPEIANNRNTWRRLIHNGDPK